jgi:hypothetical protein
MRPRNGLRGIGDPHVCCWRQRPNRQRNSADCASDDSDHLPAGRNEVPANIDNVRIEVDLLPGGADVLPAISD